MILTPILIGTWERCRLGVTLEPEASWQTALTSNLSQQKLYNNVVKELLNGLIRSFSWILLSLVRLNMQQ